MDVTTIIVLVIVGIVVYSLFSMRRNPGKTGNSQNQQENGNKGNDSFPPPGNTGKRGGGYAKWVGGGLGWVFGGPIGAILGVALGSMFDGMKTGANVYQGTPRGDFSLSLLVLSAAVMKADQKIVKSELDYVRNFFVHQFGEDEGNRLILMLREILKQDINVQEVSIQVGQYMDYSVKLQLLNYLFGIAAADGQYHPDEVGVIEDISRYMGISSSDFISVKAMFVRDTNWAYDVLEITTQATDDEVKRAYRDMAKKHHPDKVAHLGEDVKKSATEKFQKINAAYEEIKKQRNLK